MFNNNESAINILAYTNCMCVARYTMLACRGESESEYIEEATALAFKASNITYHEYDNKYLHYEAKCANSYAGSAHIKAAERLSQYGYGNRYKDILDHLNKAKKHYEKAEHHNELAGDTYKIRNQTWVDYVNSQ